MTEYSIGQQYQSRGKNPRLCTVVDIWKTYNNKGELVQVRYVSTHEFMGQVVTEHDVLAATITMSLLNNKTTNKG